MNAYGGPPPPYEPPSNLRPPWRDQRDDTPLMILVGFVGGVIPWLIVAMDFFLQIATEWRATTPLAIVGGMILVLLLITAIVGAIVPKPRWFKALSYGLLIGLAFVVLIGACIGLSFAACLSMFNS